MKLHIVVGRSPKGEYTSLYCGSDGDEAQEVYKGEDLSKWESLFLFKRPSFDRRRKAKNLDLKPANRGDIKKQRTELAKKLADEIEARKAEERAKEERAHRINVLKAAGLKIPKELQDDAPEEEPKPKAQAKPAKDKPAPVKQK